MQSLIAGFVAGNAVGIISLGLFASRALDLEAAVRRMHAHFPGGTPLPSLTVGFAMLYQSAWGLAGFVVGAVYWSIRADAADGLGSPAWVFSLVVVALTLAAGMAAAWRRVRWWPQLVLLALALAGSFGWLLPNLAEA